MIMYELLYSI